MIKLSLNPDLRFANDKLVNRHATITLGTAPAFNGTFAIMPASASTQAAITAEATVPAEGVIVGAAGTKTVELEANVIKTVHFNKGQTEIDTGLVLKEASGSDPAEEPGFFTLVDTTNYELDEHNHGSHRTLVIKRKINTEAETAEVEFSGVMVATGSLVGNTMGFKIKGGDPVRIHALCHWVGHAGLKKNLESFKMVTKDHDALVLSLDTNSSSPAKPE